MKLMKQTIWIILLLLPMVNAYSNTTFEAAVRKIDASLVKIATATGVRQKKTAISHTTKLIQTTIHSLNVRKLKGGKTAIRDLESDYFKNQLLESRHSLLKVVQLTPDKINQSLQALLAYIKLTSVIDKQILLNHEFNLTTADLVQLKKIYTNRIQTNRRREMDFWANSETNQRGYLVDRHLVVDNGQLKLFQIEYQPDTQTYHKKLSSFKRWKDDVLFKGITRPFLLLLKTNSEWFAKKFTQIIISSILEEEMMEVVLNLAHSISLITQRAESIRNIRPSPIIYQTLEEQQMHFVSGKLNDMSVLLIDAVSQQILFEKSATEFDQNSSTLPFLQRYIKKIIALKRHSYKSSKQDINNLSSRKGD